MQAKQYWLRYRFWLSGLVLLASAWFFYRALNPQFPPPWSEQPVGPFTATPMPADNAPPYPHGDAWLKDFSVRFCDGCVQRIRMAHLSVGAVPKPLGDDLEGVLHGNALLQHVHAPFPAEVRPSDRLWLTVEDWQGRSYHAAWTLEGAVVARP